MEASSLAGGFEESGQRISEGDSEQPGPGVGKSAVGPQASRLQTDAKHWRRRGGDTDMGSVGNVSSVIRGAASRSGIRAARISKEDTANKPARRRARSVTSAPAAKKVAVKEKPLMMERFNSVWDALGFSQEEKANLEVRSSLMIQLEVLIEEHGWTQAVAARKCGVSQPRINDLLRGRIDKFSIDALINMAGALGQKIEIEFHPA